VRQALMVLQGQTVLRERMALTVPQEPMVPMA
jgi:hypothetical protein